MASQISRYGDFVPDAKSNTKMHNDINGAWWNTQYIQSKTIDSRQESFTVTNKGTKAQFWPYKPQHSYNKISTSQVIFKGKASNAFFHSYLCFCFHSYLYSYFFIHLIYLKNMLYSFKIWKSGALPKVRFWLLGRQNLKIRGASESRILVLEIKIKIRQWGALPKVVFWLLRWQNRKIEAASQDIILAVGMIHVCSALSLSALLWACLLCSENGGQSWID